MTSFKHLKPPSPRNSAMTHPAVWYLSNVGLNASHIVSRFSLSIGMAVECFKVGIMVVRNLTALMVRTSAQTTIRRYFGSKDKGYLSFDGSSTVLLGLRVVFPTNASGFGTYIRNAVRTSDEVTGQFEITLASKALLKFSIRRISKHGF